MRLPVSEVPTGDVGVEVLQQGETGPQRGRGDAVLRGERVEPDLAQEQLRVLRRRRGRHPDAVVLDGNDVSQRIGVGGEVTGLDQQNDHCLLRRGVLDDAFVAHKQALVIRLIEAGDFTAYADALRYIVAVKDDGIRVAAASSSKNAQLFLSKIRLDTFAAEHGISSPSLRPGLTLLEYFDADVSGRDFAHGKPHPEMFLTAAGLLAVEPERAMVIEAAAAEIVVTTLDDVDRAALADGRLATTGA